MITNIKRGLRTIFGIYALLVFLAVLIIVFILYIPIFAFVNSKRAPFIAHKYISRPWAASLLILFGVRLIIKNKEYLDKNETYVFIGNHSSQLDIPAYAVLDWSASYKLNNYAIKLGTNNLTNKSYFTRRTDEYPGPGIIPAVGRSFYVGLTAKF